jgi:TrmH family RNA methyltransferase
MREKYHECIVEGNRIVAEALRSDWTVEFLCVSQSGREHIASLPAFACPAYITGDDEFEQFTTTENSQGIIAVVRQQAVSLPDMLHGHVIALDRVADPGNLGTIIRTADWFGASAVLLGNGCAELFNPKTVRSTMGSLFHLLVVPQVDLLGACSTFKLKGVTLWCADASGNSVNDSHRLTKDAILVVGSEAHGVDPRLMSLAEEALAIPRIGQAESLNAASATSALLALLCQR